MKVVLIDTDGQEIVIHQEFIDKMIERKMLKRSQRADPLAITKAFNDLYEQFKAEVESIGNED